MRFQSSAIYSGSSLKLYFLQLRQLLKKNFASRYLQKIILFSLFAEETVKSLLVNVEVKGYL